MSTTWPGESAHPREELQDLLDGRLPAPAAEAVRAHMATCDVCRREWVGLERARAAAALLREERDVPSDLFGAVAGTLDAEDASTRGVPVADHRAEPTADVIEPRSAPVLRTRRWVVLSGLAAAATVGLLVWGRRRRPAPPLPLQVARDFAAVDGGTLALERRTAQVGELEAFFAQPSGGIAPLRVRVFDLAMMGFTLEGGTRHVLNGVPSALYAYRTASGERIVCQMFEGGQDDLPATTDIRENNGFRFHVSRVVLGARAVTLVFWQEGDIVCVLASALPAEEVVKLAVAKAMRPA